MIRTISFRTLFITLLALCTTLLLSCGGGGGGGDGGGTAVPAVPVNVAITAGDGRVVLSWDAAAGAASYDLYWKTSPGVTAADNPIEGVTSPYVLTGLANGTACYCAVAAVNAAGESPLSSEVSATPQPPAPSVPAAPTGVSASAAYGQVVIQWSQAAGVSSYNIYWSTASGVSRTTGTKLATVLSPYTHSGLTNGTTFYYVVTAANEAGESPESAEVSATPQVVAPGAPVGVAAVPRGSAFPSGGQVTISWNPTLGAQSYNLYWSMVPGETKATGWKLAGVSSPYIQYPPWNNTTYYYVVTAVNIAGEGPESAEVSAQPMQFFSKMLQNILAGDAQAGDNFGYSVSINGDYAIVGAYYEDGGPGDPLSAAGAAYIFHRTGVNTWDAGTKIVAPDAQADDWFGISVSISGDYAIVGAHGEDGGEGNTLSAAGVAYIFHRTGVNTWDAGTKIMAPDAQADDFFGISVSISGDYAIIGAHGEDGGAGDPLSAAGAAYIFRRTGVNTWDAGTKIVAPDAQAFDWFGISVSISGDYVIVGARYEDGGAGNPKFDAGAAYIFRRTGVNTWDAGTKIVASDAQADDWFGNSVSISGDYAIVGAHGEDGGAGNPKFDAGAAYIFHRTGVNAWDAGTKIMAPFAQAGDFFGASVSISGDNAIVGAYYEDGGAGDLLPDAGAAYIFLRNGVNTWTSGTKIVAPDPLAFDYFGCSVSISGDYAIVGAYGEDGGAGNPMADAGAAYFYK